MEIIYNRKTTLLRRKIEGEPSWVNTPDDFGRTPLILCAKEGWLKGVQLLLEAGALQKAIDKDGRSAIFHAVSNGFIAIVEALDWYDSKDDHDTDLLQEAIDKKHYALVNMLAPRYADWQVRKNKAGFNHMTLASFAGIDYLALLEKHGFSYDHCHNLCVNDIVSEFIAWRRSKINKNIRGPRQAEDAFKSLVEDSKQEIFVLLGMDTQAKILCKEVLFKGCMDRSQVDKKILFRKLLEAGCTTFIVAHNHPSGVTEPSSCDRELTKAIYEASKLMEFVFHDHIIVGTSTMYDNQPTYSFRESSTVWEN